MISININNVNITISDNKISIKDRFTLILGKIKKDNLNHFQKNGFFDIIKNYLHSFNLKKNVI